MKQTNSGRFSAKHLVYSALFAAIAIILGRFTAVYPVPGAKYTLDKFVLFMSGMFFGPAAGSMIGFIADFIGGHLFGIGWTAPLCVPAVLYGFFGGIFRKMLQKNFRLSRLTFAYLFPIVIGSILYQSPVLALLYSPTTFWEATVTYLASRSIQFALMLILEVTLIYVLICTNIFSRVGLWPHHDRIRSKINMTAEQAIEYIHSVCWKGSIPGLGRTNTLLSLMGDPHKKLKYVHIAGTNGKGSTAAMTASILQKAGYKVGLYTSPYIYRFNERMQINGQQIPDEELAQITQWVKPLAQSMTESPTEFELVSCIAFEYFKRNKCDIVVLEVGMGGALDSTNVIPCPEVAVITNIGLDHTDVLGKTVEEIALTKAGIFKEGGNAVVYRGTEGVEAVFETPLFKTSPHVFIRKEHPVCNQDILTYTQLMQYPFVSYEQGNHNVSFFTEEIMECIDVKKHIEISDRASLMNVLMTTDSYTIGTGIMPSALNEGKIISVPLESSSYYNIGYILHTDRKCSDLTAHFINMLEDLVEQIPKD